MNNTWRPFVFVAALLVLTVPAWSAPIVQNPSFETNVLASPFVGDATTVPNWTHGGLGDGPHWAVGYSDGNGSITTAGQGNQFVTLGGGGSLGTGSWSQNVSGFTVNVPYTLSFMLAGETTSDSNQVVTAEIIDTATQQQNFTAPASAGANYWRTWQTFNMTFTANAATEQLFFTSTTVHDVGLDNISITQVATGAPEPASCVLFGAGIAALALVRRRIV